MVLEMKITNSTINSHVFGKPFILGSESVNSNESECKENIVVFPRVNKSFNLIISLCFLQYKYENHFYRKTKIENNRFTK